MPHDIPRIVIENVELRQEIDSLKSRVQELRALPSATKEHTHHLVRVAKAIGFDDAASETTHCHKQLPEEVRKILRMRAITNQDNKELKSQMTSLNSKVKDFAKKITSKDRAIRTHLDYIETQQNRIQELIGEKERLQEDLLVAQQDTENANYAVAQSSDELFELREANKTFNGMCEENNDLRRELQSCKDAKPKVALAPGIPEEAFQAAEAHGRLLGFKQGCEFMKSMVVLP